MKNIDTLTTAVSSYTKSVYDFVAGFVTSMSPKAKKTTAGLLVTAIAVSISNPFGIFDSAEEAKAKAIAENNAVIVSSIAKLQVEIVAAGSGIVTKQKENADYSNKIAVVNSEICGLVKQLGNESVENGKNCSSEEMKVFAIPKNYDAVAAYIEKNMKVGKAYVGINEAKASSEVEVTSVNENNNKEAVKVSTGTIGELPPGSKLVNGIPEHKYVSPDSLFYGTHVFDKCYVSQNEKDHFKNNGRIATDVACDKKAVFIYAPDYKNSEITYTVKVAKNWDTGSTVELHFKSPEDGTDYYWVLGHVGTMLKDGDKVKTGNVIGLMDLSGITTGYHLHQELWQGSNNVSYKIVNKVLKDRELKK